MALASFDSLEFFLQAHVLLLLGGQGNFAVPRKGEFSALPSVFPPFIQAVVV